MDVPLELGPPPASKAPLDDARSIIYVDDTKYFQFKHHFTQSTIVSLSDPNNDKKKHNSPPLAYAQLRPSSSAPHQSMLPASFGLRLSLQETCPSFVTLRPAQVPIPSALHICLEVSFDHALPLAHLPKLARSIERLAPHCFHGTLAWPSRRLSLPWRQCLDTARITAMNPALPLLCLTNSTTFTIQQRNLHFDRHICLMSLIDTITENMGGYSSVIQNLLTAIGRRWTTPSLSIGHVLLHGLPGVGKSYLLSLLRPHLRTQTVVCPDLFATNVGQSEANLKRVFFGHQGNNIQVFILEDIDAFTSRHSMSPLDLSLQSVFDAVLCRLPPHVLVIGTTHQSLDSLNDRIKNRLSHHILMPPPSVDDRFTILTKLCRPTLVSANPSMLRDVSTRATGFVAADLVKLVRESIVTFPSDNYDFDRAFAVVGPSMLSETKLFAATPASVETYGLHDVRSMLRASIQGPLENSAPYRKLGIPPPRGILLTGPSGTGKSHLLRVLAADLAPLATVIPVVCTDLVTKVVGGTERALAALFQTARSAAPSVLLFDQIENLAPMRGFDTSTEQTFDRVLSMLLLEMDGVTSGSSLASMSHSVFLQQHVIVVATATHSQLLDPAILRPGRLDLELALTFPSTSTRKEVISHLAHHVPLNMDDSRFENMDAVVAWMVARSDGASVGQLQSVFQEAALACLRVSIEATHISTSTLLAAFKQEITKVKQI